VPVTFQSTAAPDVLMLRELAQYPLGLVGNRLDTLKTKCLERQTPQGVHVRVIDAPPSTSEAVPVTKDESSDAR
jgi:hypothetical protein